MTLPTFPDAAGEAAWRSAVAKVLKGGDFDARLVTRTLDGIPVLPLYPAAEAAAPDSGRPPCAIFSRVEAVGEPGLDGLARHELDNGADGLVIVMAGSASARGFGLDPVDLGTALDGVALDRVRLRIDPAPFAGLDALRGIFHVAETRRIDAGALDIDAGLDPLGFLARSGESPEAWPAVSGFIADVAGTIRERGHRGPVFRVNGRPHHEAGASEAQELAAVVATGVTYVRALDAAGTAARDARLMLSFQLAADADQLLTIAKFRALRRLWAHVEAAVGIVPAPIRLHGATSWRMMAKADPHTNLLRGALACAGAMLGGADSVTVLPFTAPLGLPDPFARRLARNTALVLRDEAGLDRVADPAAGSGALEALTEALCAEAWDLFGDLERVGGLPEALSDGSWQSRVAIAQGRRAAELLSGTRAVLGTTVYPLPAGAASPAVLKPLPAVPRAAAGAMPSLRDDQLYGAAP